MNIKEKKKLLRLKFINKRKSFPQDLKVKADKKIQDNLKKLFLYEKAGCVCFYFSQNQEVDTRVLIKRELLNKGKIVVLPKVENRDLDLYIVNSLKDLEKGSFNIYEPKLKCKKVKPKDVDLFIIPGTAFTLSGLRLGRGGGYYDRLLKKIRKPTVGLAYSFQIVKDMPFGKSDQKVNVVITNG